MMLLALAGNMGGLGEIGLVAGAAADPGDGWSRLPRAAAPMPNADCLKKKRRVRARSRLPEGGSVCSMALVLTQRFVHVQQDVGNQRPSGPLRGIGGRIGRNADDLSSGLSVGPVSSELFLKVGEHAILFGSGRRARNHQPEAVAGASRIVVATFFQHSDGHGAGRLEEER